MCEVLCASTKRNIVSLPNPKRIFGNFKVKGDLKAKGEILGVRFKPKILLWSIDVWAPSDLGGGDLIA